MSVHSDLIDGVGTPLLLDTHGETLTIQIKGQSQPVAVTALVNRARTVRKYGDHGSRLVEQRRVTFTTDEASRFGGVASLQMNAVITYGDVDYAIAEKPSELSGTVAVLLERPAAENRTEGYYQRQ